ncbi:MAG: transposase [Candidatus Marinimicrobia bacterium CG08_land_8_20_14_0_20_45_22]|nr:MAG: transposase [Candidatus Marinimicrobia bacterium CG08_land_8_20_14_0_20_45_22]
MSHAYVANWLHIIWSTKNRRRCLMANNALPVREHLIAEAAKTESSIETINIQPEHVHILVNLPATQSIDNFIHQLKGESSHWINDEKIIPGRFNWQKGYGAFSVSVSMVEMVKQYIQNQQEHHRRKPFAEEYKEFLEKHGFVYDDENR